MVWKVLLSCYVNGVFTQMYPAAPLSFWFQKRFVFMIIWTTVLFCDYQKMVAMQSTPEMENSTAPLKAMIKKLC